MHPFDLYLPTRIIFGKGRITELPSAMHPYGKKVLLAYGGGSIKRSGLYDTVKTLLKDFEVFELGGIAPNPRISSVREGVKLCKDNGIDMILAVGGGSTIDCAKNIACGAKYDGDPWDLVIKPELVGEHIPLFDVLTLAATGSEYDAAAVITNEETNEKLTCWSNTFPVASICDPSYTCSVPASQTAAGAADILSHTFEQYLVKDGNMISDGFCETILRAVFANTPRAIENPNDEEARAQLMLASSFGCCGLLAMGRTPSPWVCHAIEHEVSAWHDITHGTGLAIITPHWMRYSLNADTAPRFAQYGINVWGLDAKADAMHNAEAAIARTEEFFRAIGIPPRLRDVGVDDTHFEEMADHIRSHWFGNLENAIRPVDRAGIIEILRSSL